MKVYQTNRLFFKKFPYKVETMCLGASMIKRTGLEETLAFCDDQTTHRYYHTRNYTLADKKDLKKFVKAVEPFITKDIQLRAEMNNLSFFLTDKDAYLNLIKAARPWIKSITEPANDTDLESLQSKNSLVICDNLPHNKFKFRIYLRYQMPHHVRLKFLEWAKNYEDHIKISKRTKKWMEMGESYLQDPFLYIEDQSNLLMVSLFLGEYRRSTQEFVLRNTGK